MLTAMVLALGCAGLLPPARAALIAAIWSEPLVAALVLAPAVFKTRQQQHRLPHSLLVAAFLRAVSSELRAGRSLRSAVFESTQLDPALGLERPARLAETGRPMEEVAAAMAAYRGMGAAAAAIRVLARTGGPAITVFEGLASDASDEAALDRERRELTVQARVSVAVVGGFPVAVLGYQILTGRALDLIRLGTAGAGIVAVGTLLLAAGLGAVALLMRRARR